METGETVNAQETRNITVVRKYFDGCNSGDVEVLRSTLAPDVVHYFLPATFPPVSGAEHLARYWRKYKEMLNPVWAIDHILASGEEVVSEWSCVWTPRGTGLRLMARGTEWYRMREEKIAEVRAYFIAERDKSAELNGFPYGERGYLPGEGL